MYHSESAARGPESSESEWADDVSPDSSPASGPAPLPDADALVSWTGLGDTSLGKLEGSRVVGLGLIKKVLEGPLLLLVLGMLELWVVDDSDTERVIEVGGTDDILVGALVGVTVGLGVDGAGAAGGVPATGREMVKPSSTPARSRMAPPAEEKGEEGELP